MSKQYPGGIISKTAPTPSGPYADSTAPGVWTLEQQAYWTKLGQWPTAGNVNPNAFIENLFSTYLYTGNGTSQTITNGIDLSGQGGLVWLKYRSGAASTTYHHVYDSARGKSGNTSYNYLYTNTTSPQGTGAFGPTSFNTDGFSLNSYLNESTIPYVSWTFRKQPKFFDVVTYTGTGSVQNIAHNLGSTPGCVIIKSISYSDYWVVYHRGANGGTNPEQYGFYLNDTSPQFSGSVIWNNTAPTSSVFTVGTYARNNTAGETYVAYLFAHDAGGFGLTGSDNVISCGSYTASGSSGTVTLGYEPQWILIKNSDGGASGIANWQLIDNMRGMPVGSNDQTLYPNLSNAEASSNRVAPTATGFSVSNASGNLWDSGAQYIYIAIRRGPMAVPTLGTSVLALSTWTGSSGNKDLGSQTANFGTGYLSILKSRTAAQTTGVFDTLRGQALFLATSTTDAESVDGANAGISVVNNQLQLNSSSYFGAGGDGNGQNYIGWNFRRAPSFFDEVCYTGDGTTDRAISHNLGVVPELIFNKPRNYADNWEVYQANVGLNSYFYLNSTAAPASNPGNWSTMTSSVFGAGYALGHNVTSRTYVTYLFATCPGVSKVGTYTGTGTTQQINCGFTGGSRFVLIKRTDSTGDWYVWDSARGIVAGNDPYLLLNSAAAEVTSTDYVDTYSAGFEISSTAPAAINASGGTFIFLAIA